MGKIRVLVVEDSLTVRRRLCEVLAGDPDIEVVGEAEDGKRAVELCDALRPSVVTLDMLLPIMSGVSATEYIMAHFPTPILIVSASTNRGDLFKTYDALSAGAVDVLEKPRGDEPPGVWEAKFLSAVKLVSRIKVITHLRARLRAPGRLPSYPPLRSGAPAYRSAALAERRTPSAYQALAVGASTGGPGAIVTVLREVPTKLPFPILVVLHIGAPFGAAFAEWLDDQTPHRVARFQGGELAHTLAGQIVLAPPDWHMSVRGGRIYLGQTPERHSCRPSVDVLFESLAVEYGPRTIACLLTGMGRDGAQGLLDIRRAGGLTIAQDEATSVVYGMPREAALLGAPKHTLALGDIGLFLADVLATAPQGAT
jgi:two-component system chemotaxis response regulator CheB